MRYSFLTKNLSQLPNGISNREIKLMPNKKVLVVSQEQLLNFWPGVCSSELSDKLVSP